MFSRLWLAPAGEEDGQLNIYEVYGLGLDQTELVVLSACQTQGGEVSAGDEIISLNRAFLYGSPTVVSSLWSVDDQATGELMSRFYTHLRDGMSKAQALQAAQSEIRKDPAHPEWQHPYYWAAFVLNGDPGEMDPGALNADEKGVEGLGSDVQVLDQDEPIADSQKKSPLIFVLAGISLVALVAILVLVIRRMAWRSS
jgi:hypothetical protein